MKTECTSEQSSVDSVSARFEVDFFHAFKESYKTLSELSNEQCVYERGWDEGFQAGLEAGKPKWMPIETAPKDGTKILVFPASWAGQSSSIAEWCEDEYKKTPKPYWKRNDCIHIGRNRDIEPTHWMPLPNPPEE